MNENPKTIVSITAPVFNEAEALPEFIKRIVKAVAPLEDKYSFEVILVDDGSTDGSQQIVRGLMTKEPRLQLVQLRRNYGQTAALQAGFDHARGDIIITMDADLQHFPEEIPLFLKKIEAGNDVVCGWRKERKEGILRRWPSKVANWLIRFFTTVSIHDVGTAFRAYRREIAQDIHILGENHLNLPIIASMVGAQLDEVIIKNVPRGAGESSFTLHRTLNVALDIFFVAFFTRYIDRPIRIFGKVAAVLFALATLIACILAWQALVEGIPVVREHSGWFNMSFIIYIISIQVMLTGILAEVLTQLHYQPGRRESYRVRQVYKTPPSSNDLSGDEAD